jgi:hypothetical protein
VRETEESRSEQSTGRRPRDAAVGGARARGCARDNVAVLTSTPWAVGARGDSSLDDAVRATAGLVRAHAFRSRRVLLVIATPEPGVHWVRSVGHDWDGALEALAAVEPSSGTRLRELVGPRGALAATLIWPS